MRVLLVSWEYPPVVVGGLGRHVGALATHLVDAGHDVVVLTRQPTGTDAATHPTTDTVVDGVRVVRVAEDPPHLEFTSDLVAWTLALGHAMVRAALPVLRGWRPDVIHAHDWLVAHAATALREVADVPLVATIHATEAGRHGGWLSAPLNRQVHSVEWWLANTADALVTCSQAMRDEVAGLFDVDPDGVTVLHNGIDASGWSAAPAAAMAPSCHWTGERRHSRAGSSPAGSPTLVTFGRLEWEKGVQDVIAALPAIRRAHPGTRLMVAGSGSHAGWLADRARAARVRRAVTMLGHVDDAALVELLGRASAVVLPSRYEPFGIVALEAAAAGAPLVASRAGGLGEVVLDGVTGLSFDPGDVTGCAAAVIAALDAPGATQRRATAARDRLASDFAWPAIAADTAALYARTACRCAVSDEPGPPLGRPKIPTGNVFGRT
jgi:glycogen(starch) synthase